MESIRYYIALFLVLIMPGVFLFWFSIHPFVRFWRKVGARRTLAIHYGLILVLAAALFQIRAPLLSVEFGASPVLMLLAAPIFVLAILLRMQLSKRLPTKVLMGLPELAPDRYTNRLVTEGVYARIRHPRYVEILLTVLAYALVSNYLAAYVVVLMAAVWMVLVVRVEEKELRDRFGRDYEAYCSQVPRFIPRW